MGICTSHDSNARKHQYSLLSDWHRLYMSWRGGPVRLLPSALRLQLTNADERPWGSAPSALLWLVGGLLLLVFCMYHYIPPTPLPLPPEHWVLLRPPPGCGGGPLGPRLLLACRSLALASASACCPRGSRSVHDRWRPLGSSFSFVPAAETSH